MHEFSLKNASFEGPLDVLLALLQEKKLEINEVALSDVTAEYLAYLDTVEEIKPDELADFLVVAAKLLLLKSHALLPQLISADDDGITIEDQLKIYRRFVDASKQLNVWWQDGTRRGYTRIEPPRKVPIEQQLFPSNMTPDALHLVMKRLIQRLAPPKALPRTHIDKTVSLRERVKTLRTLLSRGNAVSFRELLQDKESRTEVIVSFLAILELIKHHHATVEQADPFGDMVISAY